jgi:hypothetical protein
MAVAFVIVGGVLASCGLNSLRAFLYHGRVGRLPWPVALAIGMVGSVIAITGSALSGR